MGKNKQTRIFAYRLLSLLLTGLIVCSPYDTFASTWSPTVLVNTESFQIVDDGDSTTDIELRFGGILNEILEWDRTNSRFHFTDDLLVDGALSASGAVSFESSLDVSGAISGATIHAEGSLSASGTLFLQGTLTGATAFHGPFTSDCDDTTNSKLLWDSTTGKL